MKTRTQQRGGFTLVELLTVIAIIGLLVGLVVPAVMFAMTQVKKQAIAMEVVTLSDAVEKYQQKYNDYPPDGSSATVLERHLRKIFPQIAASELALLASDTIPGVGNRVANNVSAAGFTGSPVGIMDPAEAIVFFLGGFSEDPAYPISGVGGPIFISNQAGVQVTSATPANMRQTVQYNTDRNAPLYEFKQD